MFSQHPDYFINGDYDKDRFRCDNFPFVFSTPQDCRALLQRADVKILHEVAADGMSELLKAKINEMDEKSFAQYLRFQEYLCEKPEFLGASNHLLFVAEKETSPETR